MAILIPCMMPTSTTLWCLYFLTRDIISMLIHNYKLLKVINFQPISVQIVLMTYSYNSYSI